MQPCLWLVLHLKLHKAPFQNPMQTHTHTSTLWTVVFKCIILGCEKHLTEATECASKFILRRADLLKLTQNYERTNNEMHESFSLRHNKESCSYQRTKVTMSQYKHATQRYKQLLLWTAFDFRACFMNADAADLTLWKASSVVDLDQWLNTGLKALPNLTMTSSSMESLSPQSEWQETTSLVNPPKSMMQY